MQKTLYDAIYIENLVKPLKDTFKGCKVDGINKIDIQQRGTLTQDKTIENMINKILDSKFVCMCKEGDNVKKRKGNYRNMLMTEGLLNSTAWSWRPVIREILMILMPRLIIFRLH